MIKHETQVEKTYHTHPSYGFLTDVIDNVVCYKCQFVNAPSGVLELLVCQDNALSYVIL